MALCISKHLKLWIQLKPNFHSKLKVITILPLLTSLTVACIHVTKLSRNYIVPYLTSLTTLLAYRQLDCNIMKIALHFLLFFHVALLYQTVRHYWVYSFCHIVRSSIHSYVHQLLCQTFTFIRHRHWLGYMWAPAHLL